MATGSVNVGVASLPNMLDWSAYDTIFDWSGLDSSVSLNSWGEFVNIAGEGYLVFVRGYSTGLNELSNPDIRITVDGNSSIFQGMAYYTRNGNLILQPIYFKNSLKIELYNRYSQTDFLALDYTYLLKKNKPTLSQTIIDGSNPLMTTGQTNTTSMSDVINLVGSGYLLGIEASSRYSSGGGQIYYSLNVDGVNVMNARPNVTAPASYAYKQHIFMGPIRFNSNLVIQHRTTTSATYGITRAFYLLD